MAEKATLWQFSMLIPLKILSDSENPWFSRLQIHLLLKWIFRVPPSSMTCGNDLLIHRRLHMQPYLLSEITNPTPPTQNSFACGFLHAASSTTPTVNPPFGVRLRTPSDAPAPALLLRIRFPSMFSKKSDGCDVSTPN